MSYRGFLLVFDSWYNAGEVMGMIRTRQWIMDNFMTLAREKPLNKITVAQIVERCGLNRNTFYYYFEDIPSLIEAIFAQQAAALLP